MLFMRLCVSVHVTFPSEYEVAVGALVFVWDTGLLTGHRSHRDRCRRYRKEKWVYGSGGTMGSEREGIELLIPEGRSTFQSNNRQHSYVVSPGGPLVQREPFRVRRAVPVCRLQAYKSMDQAVNDGCSLAALCCRQDKTRSHSRYGVLGDLCCRRSRKPKLTRELGHIKFKFGEHPCTPIPEVSTQGCPMGNSRAKIQILNIGVYTNGENSRGEIQVG